MSTNGLIKVFDKDEDLLTTILVHWDGYPSVLGRELNIFNSTKKIVNGFAIGDNEVSNGMGCYAASLIAVLKQCVGNVYIVNDIDSGDYTYKIMFDRYNNIPIIYVSSYGSPFKLLSDHLDNIDKEEIDEAVSSKLKINFE